MSGQVKQSVDVHLKDRPLKSICRMIIDQCRSMGIKVYDPRPASDRTPPNAPADGA